jgi:hypothetical protein
MNPIVRARAGWIAAFVTVALIALVLVRGVDVGSIAGLKPQLERLAGEASGRTVTMAGPARLSLLPVPTLEAEEIRFALNGTGTDGTVAEARTARFGLAFLPLLTGRIALTSLTLQEPVLRVDQAEDGQWTLPFDLDDLRPASAVTLLAIENGTVLISRPEGPLTLRAVSASFTAGGANGPFNLAGGLILNNVPVSFEVSAGAALPAGIPLRASLSVTTAENSLRFSGLLNGRTESDPRPGLQGELRVTAVRLGDLLPGIQTDQDIPALADPLSLTARIAGRGDDLMVDAIELTVGEQRLEGSVSLTGSGTARQGALVLTTARLDLDRFSPASGPVTTDADPVGKVLSQLNVIPEFTLDLLADRLIWKGRTIQDLRLLGRFAEDTLTLDSLAATLPGDSVIKGQGSLWLEGSQTAFDGIVSISSQSLRDLIALSDADLSQVPVERLRNANLSGRVRYDLQGWSIVDGVGQIDTTRFDLAAQFRRPAASDSPARLTIRGNVDRLDLDSYGPLDINRLLDILPQVQPALELTATQILFTGLPIDGIRFTGQTIGRTVEFSDLHLQSAAGVTLTASGRVSLDNPAKDSDVRLSASAETLAPLFRALGQAPPVSPERLGPVSLTGQVIGQPDGSSVTAELALLGGTLQAGGRVGWTMTTPADPPELDIKLRAILPDSDALVRLWQPDWRGGQRADGEGPSGLDLYAVLSGTPLLPQLADLQGSLAGQPVSGSIQFDLRGERPRSELKLSTETLAVTPLLSLLSSGAYGGGHWDGSLALTARTLSPGDSPFSNPSLNLRWSPEKLEIVSLSAGWMGSLLTAAGTLSPGDGWNGPLDVSLMEGKWPASTARPSLSGGRFSITGRFQLTGWQPGAPWQGVSGPVEVNWQDTSLAGYDLLKLTPSLQGLTRVSDLPPLLTTLQGAGQTALDHVRLLGQLESGLLQVSGLTTDARGTTVGGTGSISLPHNRADLLFAVDPGSAPPAFTVRIAGPLDRPVWTYDSKALERWITRNQPAGPDAVRGILDRLKKP